jgi:dTDP-4-dehydrorhamnose reductase
VTGAWLVTGASGLLGSHVVLEAVARARPVIACYGAHPVTFAKAEAVPLSLLDAAAVRRLIATHKPPVIVHCAAETRVDYCEEHPEHASRLNVDATVAVASAAARINAKLVYVSTDSVFDGRTGHYTEDDVPAPCNVYAATKLAGEEAARTAADHLVLRTNMFGWSPRGRTLAEWVVDTLQRGERVPGFTDVVFAPVIVNQLAGIIGEAVDRGLRGTYHVGATAALTKFEFARLIARAFGYDPGHVTPSVSADAGLRARRPLKTDLVSDRIVAALGRPMPAIADGILMFRQLRDRGHHLTLRAALASNPEGDPDGAISAR